MKDNINVKMEVKKKEKMKRGRPLKRCMSINII
jgi:hypothetical protein